MPQIDVDEIIKVYRPAGTRSYCEIRETAERLADGKVVREQRAFKKGERIFAPIKLITPTPKDIRERKQQKEEDRVLELARNAGLTDEDIKVLQGIKL